MDLPVSLPEMTELAKNNESSNVFRLGTDSHGAGASELPLQSPFILLWRSRALGVDEINDAAEREEDGERTRPPSKHLARSGKVVVV